MGSAPVYDVDFYSDAFIADPLPHYRAMRALGPLVWLPHQSAYAAVQHRAVVDVLRAPDLFQSGQGLSLNDDVNKRLIGSTLNTDGDRHKRQRAITAKPIMPTPLKDLEPFIQRAAADLAALLCERGRFDAVHDFAQILPMSIVTELVGLPAHGKAKMLEWAAATFNLFDGFNQRSQDSFAELVDLRDFLDEYGQPEHLAPDGLARRIFDEAPKSGFSVDDAAQLMRDYINPSLDTTISAAGFFAYYFATCPDQWDAIREDVDLIDNAIEEIVRLSTPIRSLSRRVTRDTVYGDVDLRTGDRIMVVYASANRDESVFDNPDAFDVRRKTHKHVGFGHGKHMCMGLHLARLELKHLVREMRTRVNSWHLDGAPETAMNNTIRAFEQLPVRVELG